MIKIYNKRGVHNYKEKKMEKAIQAYLEKHPDEAANFVPAETIDELKAYHDKFTSETVEIISETKTDPEQAHKDFRKGMEETVQPKDIEDDSEMYEPRPDPMNRDEPIIRDYVNDSGFKDEDPKKDTGRSNYDEPTSFKDSFGLPGEDIGGDNKKQQEPINPKPKQPSSGPDPDAKIKRKSKKKFTKYAIDAVCALAERGITWYATKDITAQKLAEYVEKDEISQQALDLLVYIDANTQGSVKQFFSNRIETVQEFAKFTIEEKEDLAEALEDFLEYKKIEINPTINIAVIFAGMLFERALKAMTIKAETNSILEQLRAMHTNTEEQYGSDVPDENPAEAPAPETEQPEVSNELATQEPE